MIPLTSALDTLSICIIAVFHDHDDHQNEYQYDHDDDDDDDEGETLLKSLINRSERNQNTTSSRKSIR